MEFSETTALQDISEAELVQAAKKVSIRKETLMWSGFIINSEVNLGAIL